MSEENEDIQEPSDTSMTETLASKYATALGDYIFDLDWEKSFPIQMLEPSILINETLNIEFSYLTLKSKRVPFYFITTDSGCTGILVHDQIQGQKKWLDKKITSTLLEIDILMLDCYFSQGTNIGLMKEGLFFPYKLVV
jgi:hypothetical protein